MSHTPCYVLPQLELHFSVVCIRTHREDIKLESSKARTIVYEHNTYTKDIS